MVTPLLSAEETVGFQNHFTFQHGTESENIKNRCGVPRDMPQTPKAKNGRNWRVQAIAPDVLGVLRSFPRPTTSGNRGIYTQL